MSLLRNTIYILHLNPNTLPCLGSVGCCTTTNKNTQFLKQVIKWGHLAENRLGWENKNKNKDWDLYIMYVIKKHIVKYMYVVISWQMTFKPRLMLKEKKNFPFGLKSFTSYERSNLIRWHVACMITGNRCGEDKKGETVRRTLGWQDKPCETGRGGGAFVPNMDHTNYFLVTRVKIRVSTKSR